MIFFLELKESNKCDYEFYCDVSICCVSDYLDHMHLFENFLYSIPGGWGVVK